MNHTTELPTASDINHYKQLREINIKFNNKVTEQLPKAAILECGKKLGLLKRNTLILNCTAEVTILYDYCIFHFRKNKVSVISRHLLMSPPEKDSLEMELLESMQQTYYSICIVKEIFKDKGILVFDLINERDIFIIDLNLSQSAYNGLMIAGHIIPIGNFYRTSGAMLPISLSLFESEISLIVEKFLSKNKTLSPSQEDLFASQIIRAALRANVMENIKFNDV